MPAAACRPSRTWSRTPFARRRRAARSRSSRRRAGSPSIDDGPGLAPDDHDRAFERFYLWDRYGADRPVGTGLGLAIVAELAAAMGGRTTIESIPGEGSVFALELEPAPVPDHRAYARLTQR